MRADSEFACASPESGRGSELPNPPKSRAILAGIRGVGVGFPDALSKHGYDPVFRFCNQIRFGYTAPNYRNTLVTAELTITATLPRRCELRYNKSHAPRPAVRALWRVFPPAPPLGHSSIKDARRSMRGLSVY